MTCCSVNKSNEVIVSILLEACGVTYSYSLPRWTVQSTLFRFQFEDNNYYIAHTRISMRYNNNNNNNIHLGTHKIKDNQINT